MPTTKRQTVKLFRRGYPVARIAAMYAVSRQTIYNDLAADANKRFARIKSNQRSKA